MAEVEAAADVDGRGLIGEALSSRDQSLDPSQRNLCEQRTDGWTDGGVGEIVGGIS